MLEPTIHELLEIIEHQNRLISKLQNKIDYFTSRIEELEHKKNSGSSNLPPSSDISRLKRNQSLRGKSNRKSGGQQGHEGSNLKMSATPDKVEAHLPDRCEGCGMDLSEVIGIPLERRQVFDVPPVLPVCTEHQIFAKRCLCGCVSSGKFTAQKSANI